MILEPLGELCSKFSSLGVHCTVKSFVILIKIMVALLEKPPGNCLGVSWEEVVSRKSPLPQNFPLDAPAHIMMRRRKTGW